MTPRSDPAAPLPPAPDPWVSSSMPARRGSPPFHMTEMIEAEPALAVRILERLAAPGGPAARLADAIRQTSAGRRPILVTGCGTSEHGAIAAADVLREGLRLADLPSEPGDAGAPTAIQAFEGALEEVLGGPRGLVIGISHEGGTWATNQALERARASGATVALITASDRSPGAALADLVVATEEQDQSWCHTVGYLSPIVAAGAVAGHLAGRPIHPDGARELLAAGLAPGAVAATEAVADAIAGARRLIVVGSGVDRAAAKELVLKVEEGTHLPAAMRELETFLHGHLAGVDRGDRLVLVLADAARVDERAARAAGVLRAVAEIGLDAAAILGDLYAERIDPALTPAGRLVAPPGSGLPHALAALLATAVPLQLLTERLARERGVDPDPIRRDDPAYLRAADAAG